MSKNTFSPKGQRYEAPKEEIIAIESQGVLCASAGGGEGVRLGGAESENPTIVLMLMAAGAGSALLKRKEDKQ